MKRAIGVDLGGTNIRAAAVDELGKILGENRRLTRPERPYKAIFGDIASAIRAAANDGGVSLEIIKTIGIGCPGPLDAERGVILSPPNLKSLHGKSLGPDLESEFGIPVEIANDAYCTGLGECWLGSARRVKRAAGVTLGTGFGSWTNISGLVPEFGHMMSVSGEGALCKCGARGCPESYISSYGIIRIAADFGLKIRETAELGVLLKAKNRLAEITVGTAGRCLGRTLTDIAHIMEPQMIVVGGGIAKLGAPLFAAAEKEMRVRGLRSRVENVRVVPSMLGDDAGVLGAAKLALNYLHNGGAE